MGRTNRAVVTLLHVNSRERLTSRHIRRVKLEQHAVAGALDRHTCFPQHYIQNVETEPESRTADNTFITWTGAS